MRAIIAVNNLNYIGLGDGLPWSCREDMIHFKNLTSAGRKTDRTVVVGYNTWQTLPKPLSNRRIMLDSRHRHAYHKNFWCIGGKRTYEKYCHKFVELHISHIDDNTVGDILYPDLSKLNPECKIFHYYFKPDLDEAN